MRASYLQWSMIVGVVWATTTVIRFNFQTLNLGIGIKMEGYFPPEIAFFLGRYNLVPK